MTYLWSTGEKTQSIEISKAGIYTVEITRAAPESCTVKKTITVTENPDPEIESVTVEGSTVTILLKNPAVYYEYSIDGTNYQSSNIFQNSLAGLQTASVREINNCSYTSENFVVIIAPSFFSPNGDNYNDVWEIKGISNYPQAEVQLFDRYGKYIITLNAINKSWNGTYNAAPLPADDYWYILNLGNGKPEIKGHFSLKR
jgi:gliding motility-associated-like protein